MVGNITEDDEGEFDDEDDDVVEVWMKSLKSCKLRFSPNGLLGRRKLR